MYVSMIWKEQVYNVKYDTAERLSSKHQALLIFYLFLWYLLCSMIYFAKYRAVGHGIQIQCDHCCFEACVCSVSNLGFPESATCFLAIFWYPKRFFSTTKPGYLKKIGIDVAVKY